MIFFKKISEKLDIIKFKRIEISNLVVGHCKGTLRRSK